MAEQPATEIARFEETGDPKALESAAALLETIDIRGAADLTGRRELRHSALQGWLALLNSIDAHLDTAFDPEDFPLLSVQPPPTGDTQLPPGVDPEAVTDTPARRAYEKSIEENNSRIQVYSLQTTLRRLEVKATRVVKALVSESYLPVPYDQQELDAAFQSIENPERKSKLQERGGEFQAMGGTGG